MNSCIYEGTVSHCRLCPQRHYFSYQLYMMYLDLDELPELFDRYFFWSARRPALAWFRRRDHVGDGKTAITETIKGLIYTQTGARHSGAIRLLTHLRYFFYCMNPVSFYYCWDDTDSRIDFIVAEVHNTPWNETHCYVLDNRDNQAHNKAGRFHFTKAFHVSPFMNMKQSYQWLLTVPADTLHVSMDSFENGHKMFHADMQLCRQPISRYHMHRILLVYPLMTMKVIAAIYWQAWQLWLKKTPYFPHPKHGLQRGKP